VVFKHAIKDKTTPRRLLSLVVDTLAVSLDMQLWLQVKDLVGHGMALQVIEAMIARQQVKTELYDKASISPRVRRSSLGSPPTLAERGEM
jgi:hypothetical protein